MKILIAGMSVRAMVESAVHSGYSVLALDAFGDEDLRKLGESFSLHRDFNFRYSPVALYKASQHLRYDAVAYTSNLENHPDTLRRIAGARQIIGNSPETIRSVRNWAVLFAKLRLGGFFVPDSIFFGEKRKADKHHLWLIKPVLSGGGHGITIFKGSEMPGDQYFVQEYIPGKSCSASFVANGHECIVVGITEQLVGMKQFGSKRFGYCGNILPLPESLSLESGKSILQQVNEAAAFMTREYNLKGINGFDFILNGDRAYLTEINPRYSASVELIERAYRLPTFHLHAQASLLGSLPKFRLEKALKTNGFFGKSIIYAERNAIVPDTRDWFRRKIRDIPLSGDKLRMGNPVCTILSCGPTYAQVLTDLIRHAAKLKKEIYL